MAHRIREVRGGLDSEPRSAPLALKAFALTNFADASQVWAHNLDQELEGLREAIEHYPVVSMVNG